jgi:hypothetical protein
MGDMRVQELKEPILVSSMATRSVPQWRPDLIFGGRCGDMVAVRPIREKYGGRTYLGVLMGEIAQSTSVRITREGQVQFDASMHNPAIFVPELSTVIFGHGSWWGAIRDADHLREITDEDIDGVWYVRALKQIVERVPEEGDGNDEGSKGSD